MIQMIKNIIFLTFLVSSLCLSLFISYKYYVSLNEQTHLLFDFNSGNVNMYLVAGSPNI